MPKVHQSTPLPYPEIEARFDGIRIEGILMTFGTDDFWRHVVWSTEERVRHPILDDLKDERKLWKSNGSLVMGSRAY